MRLTLRCSTVVTLWWLIATVALYGEAAPAPVEQPPAAAVMQNDKVYTSVRSDGYEFAYQTPDGVTRTETATLKNAGTADEAISVQGSVTWLGPDGVQYTLNYLADENGFQPEGDHLPMPPEV